MLKQVSYKTDWYRGYQQALEDFNIKTLLRKLRNNLEANLISFACSESDSEASTQVQRQEVDSLAAILIAEFTNNISSESIAEYLNAIRNENWEIEPNLIHQKFQPHSLDLPKDFPNEAKLPRFLYGDKLRWLDSDSEWGIVIGRFYAFAPHLCEWTWCYLIWLSNDSPSASWTRTDIAWEDDLKALI
ncbi:MAG: hypothetical protein AAFW70_30020 [Cyanobacteria bacterium J06635_10]